MPDKATKMHVRAADLEKWQSKFSFLNVTFVGDLRADETGIENIEHSTLNIEHSEGAVYDLSGRKINGQSSMVNGQLSKGIYIMNGKKVSFK